VAGPAVDFDVARSTKQGKDNPQELKMDLVTSIAAWVRRFAKIWGPYALLELLLPGGSLVALALFLYRQGSLRFDGGTGQCGSAN
jgi:hypothetical protein